MVEYILKDPFSLYDTSMSGQCFRMNVLEHSSDYCKVILVAHGKAILIEQRGDRIYLDCPDSEFFIWCTYLGLDDDYSCYGELISDSDYFLKGAYEYGKGIHILKQGLWETVVSFIISQQNNIARIKGIVERLCTKYGTPIQYDNKTYYSFPSAEALESTTISDMEHLGMGYRGKYIIRLVDDVLEGKIDLDTILTLPYKRAKEELLKIYGVGEKVADCICLFSLGHLEAFPKDVHINRILEVNYPKGFPFERYHACAGVMQQYMFYKDLQKKG